MPDYFVPMDTTAYSDYYRRLISLGIFNRFILQYVDDHRKGLKQEYLDFNAFNIGYKLSKKALKIDNYLAYA